MVGNGTCILYPRDKTSQLANAALCRFSQVRRDLIFLDYIVSRAGSIQHAYM